LAIGIVIKNSIDLFADLLCHDLLHNTFQDVTAEDMILVIPGTPPDCRTLQNDSRDVITASTSNVQLVHCDNTAISSLTHSNDSMESKLAILLHELVKMQENEVRSDPTPTSTLRTKQMRCKACRKRKTTYKCSKCVEIIPLCNNSACLDLHRSKLLTGSTTSLL